MTYKLRGLSSPGDSGHGVKTVHRFWFDDESDIRPRVSVEISIRDTVALSSGNESEVLNSWRNSFPNLIDEALTSQEFDQQMLFILLEEDFQLDKNPFKVALIAKQFRCVTPIICPILKKKDSPQGGSLFFCEYLKN